MSFPEVLNIEHAEHIGGSESYILRLRFNDGTERELDFRRFLENSSNPLIGAYLKPELFATFRVKEGDLVWGDYELCFPVADLYDGRI
jgi:hypothetical protein